MADETFTYNGIYYDGTSIDFIAPPWLNFERVVRELQDVSMDVALDGVQDVYGTGSKSRGRNRGRAKVTNPSMTWTVEAWKQIVKAYKNAGKKIGAEEFNFTLRLKPKADIEQVELECKGSSFLGWGLQQWTNNSNLLLIKVPMFITEALFDGVELI